eukprot:2627395-Amphidinium_carterae.1
MAVRLGWLAAEGGWISNRQWFSWDEATLRAKWDSAQVLCAEVARTRPDWLPASLLPLTGSLSWMVRAKKKTVKQR